MVTFFANVVVVAIEWRMASAGGDSTVKYILPRSMGTSSRLSHDLKIFRIKYGLNSKKEI